MAEIKFIGNWSKAFQQGIKKGILALKPHPEYIERLGRELKKLSDIQDKKDELKDLEITINIHYKKRTLVQNNLIHSLYNILENEMNGGKLSRNNVKGWDLYNDDLMELAPRMQILCPNDSVLEVKKIYRIVLDEKKHNEEKTILTIVLSSSHFNIKQAAEWIEMLFNRLSDMGVHLDNSSKIGNYWHEWRSFLNREKTTLNEDLTDHGKYKQKNPICEACGCYVGDGSGHLAHIRSVGSGGVDIGWNFLHLCPKCHIGIQHQQGFTEFVKLYPHLDNKISNALIEGANNHYDNTVGVKAKNQEVIDNVKAVFNGEILGENK